MALKLSTGLRNFLLSGGSMRKAFSDAVLKIYSGSAPSSPDDAATGTLLVNITLSSGTVSSGEKSTAKQSKVVIDDAVAGHVNTIVIDSVSFSYTNGADETTTTVAAALAALIEASLTCNVTAIASADTVYLKAKFPGNAYTITVAGDGTPTLTENDVANSRSDALQLAAAASGAIAKETGTWSGTCLATGTAGYYRLVRTDDDALATSTAIRLQGTVSTSGADLNMSNINFTSGAVETINTYSITQPAS